MEITQDNFEAQYADPIERKTVNLWYYTTQEAEPNAKAQEISDAIGLGGVFVPCDDGAIWIKRGSPWCQNVRDDSDTNIKRRYLNITVEYITAN